MAVLVTRPHPDDEATAAALRARGFEVLRAPMLQFEPVPFHDDADARYGAIIVTSANALRAIAPHLADSRLLKLPLFAVGEHTAATAREAGFGEVITAKGDAGALRDLVLEAVKSKRLKKASTLLYLAGADLARDLAGELGEKGFTVVTHTTYRMIPASSLPREICDAFVANQIEAVLHYSRRSARAFLGGGKVGRRRNIGAGAATMLHFRYRCRRLARCRRDAGRGGRPAGRKCLVRGIGPCFADPIGLRRPILISSVQLTVKGTAAMVDDRPENQGSLPDSERPKREPPTIDLEASEVISETAESKRRRVGGNGARSRD